jgi:HlyD family secretion protein
MDTSEDEIPALARQPAKGQGVGEAPPAAKHEGLDIAARLPSLIVGLIIASIAALSLWYLLRPEPLLVQGEVDATRLDIAARVDGRVVDIPVARGQNIAAGTVLVRSDNPETVAKSEQALASKLVAEAQLANINAGTHPEVVAARKAARERAQASVVLAQKTYDRVKQSAIELTAAVAQARAALSAAIASRDHVYAGVRAEQMASLGAEIAKAESRLAYVQAQLGRTAYLARGDIAAKQTLDQAESDEATARADIAEARANYAAAQAGPTEEERAIADAQVKAAATALAVLERRLGKLF